MGDTEGVSVGRMAVSVTDGGREGDAAAIEVPVGESEGVGVLVGRNSVGEGESTATWVGGGRMPNVSSWLSKKLPSSIPTLMNVMTRPPSSCHKPVTWPALGRSLSLILFSALPGLVSYGTSLFAIPR